MFRVSNWVVCILVGTALLGKVASHLGEGRRVWKDFIFQDALERDEFYYGDFPDDFGWGTATAAYQIEGAWNVEGKGESVWDNYTHRAPCAYLRNQTGDVADDTYHQLDQDINAIKELGLKQYRFSISWTRLFPDGRMSSEPLLDGVRFYNETINKLLDAGVEPMVTLFHWDLPQALQDDFAGFNSSEIVDHYLNYADFCFRTFGDRVKYWFTFNEPYMYCKLGHGLGVAAPGLLDVEVGVYNCLHNMIKSHASAYHRYHELYTSASGQGVSITMSTEWAEPKDPLNETHYAAAERYLASELGILAHPIYVNGDYPELLKEMVYNKTQSQDAWKYLGSRLPTFTEDEKQMINQSSDFFSLQLYTTRYIVPFYGYPDRYVSFASDRDTKVACDTRWEQSPGSGWLRPVPWGLRRMLNYIKAEFGERPIWITENGFEDNPIYDDVKRIFYYKSHLNEVLKAIRKDGVDVRGYCAWSLVDNFEWAAGYTPKFGIYYVDFEDPARTRSKKRSSDWFAAMVEQNGFKKPSHEVLLYEDFPSSFAWGAASSAYQIEGAWKDDGKGESIWDHFTNSRGSSILDDSNGNVASDSYHRIDDDIKMLKELRVSDYSFSISWSRVLPNGHATPVNEAGIDYYNRLIDALITANIRPVVTLYHWDMPQNLQDDYAGWIDEQSIEDFISYAKLCFDRFGDRVKTWITMREPQTEAIKGFDTGEFPQKIQGEGKTVYQVAHHMILAHAGVWHLYNDHYRWSQKGKLSISLNADFGEPFDGRELKDMDAANRFMQWSLGWFMNPLVFGDYPAIMKQNVAKKSEQEGLQTSRMPEFTREERDNIKGTMDFVALNHFTAWYVTSSDIPTAPFVGAETCPFENRTVNGLDEFIKGQISGRGLPLDDVRADDTPVAEAPSIFTDMDVALFNDWTWQETGSSDQHVVPWGLRRVLRYVKDNYGNMPIYVTGNGLAEPVVSSMVTDCNFVLDQAVTTRWRDIGLNDTERVEFMQAYINEVLKAIQLDHVDVRGYFFDSLMDGFEWLSGYTQRHGMYKVDRNDMTRTAKRSAWYFADLVRENGFKPAKGQCPYIADRDNMFYGEFPSDFSWSSATSAYQIEGAWNVDGKGESIWDVFTHAGKSHDGETGDTACDSYNKYKTDVQMLKDLSVGFYRFSISWPRVIPTGEIAEGVNEAGIDYYNRLIDELLDKGIQPQVTLYHWDLPQKLQERYGGWVNQSDVIVQAFADYADLCFKRFGDRVKFWITFNEPYIVTQLGYGWGAFAPSVYQPEDGMYLAAHTLIKAHARAYHLYNDTYRPTQGGKIGITLNSNWVEPGRITNPDDIEASQRSLTFFTGWFAEPIFNSGDYSPVMKWNVGNESEYFNITYNRLPEFTPEEIELNKGTSDFFGLNHYTSNLVFPCNTHNGFPNHDTDSDTCGDGCSEWPGSASSWLYQVPWGIRKLVTWIKRNFQDPDIYITESGISEHFYDYLDDDIRVNYYKTYINEVLKAIHIDGVKVKGYTAWSLMDNFEWAEGYSERFGLHWVNFTDPDRPRIRKKSAEYYTSLIRANSFERSPSEAWGYFWAKSEDDKLEFINEKFPDEFVWGVSVAAYQTEGASTKDGRGMSIWDTFSQESGKIPVTTATQAAYVSTSITDDSSSLYSGNVASDAYYKTEFDAQMLQGLGTSRYRLSISWSRLFPQGNLLGNEIPNSLAVAHYNYVIDELMRRGLTPEVTLYHFDLPQLLQDEGGWIDSNSVSWFEKYAESCFELFGDRVKNWITIHDPYAIAWKGYGSGEHAPGAAANGLCVHRGPHIYPGVGYWTLVDNVVSIALSSDWYEPADPNNSADVSAAMRAVDFRLGWFAEPIYVTGNYPQSMIDQLELEASVAGVSRLPELTIDEQTFLRGTSDHFYVIPGTVQLVVHVNNDELEPSYVNDQDLNLHQDPDWPQYGAEYGTAPVAWGVRRLLYFAYGKYVTVSGSTSVRNNPITVGDNGLAIEETMQESDDYYRVDYYKSYLNELLKAQVKDKVPIGGYYSQFIDGFEWERGYTRRSGLFHVDFNTIDRKRAPKSSATFLSGLIKTNGFVQPEEEKWAYGTFPSGFFWGVSSAAQSIEGGFVNKSFASNWDEWIWDNDASPDSVTADQFNHWESDVELLKNLGVSHYRVSLSWSRLLNESTVQYYTDFFASLQSAGISIIADLYHHDIPANLQRTGGWTNEDTIAQFVSYANDCFGNFGQYVGHWITIAAPLEEANNGYVNGIWPPGLHDQSKAFMVAHNMLKAHAIVWDLYDNNFRSTDNGKVGFSLLANWAEPSNPNIQADYDARDQYLDDTIGWFADPVTTGDYPQSTRDRYKDIIPVFTDAESEMLIGKYDFFAIDHYTTELVNSETTRKDVSWTATADQRIKANPTGLRKVLKWITEKYGNSIPLLIAASGLPDAENSGTTGNTDLLQVKRQYINEAMKSYMMDATNLIGYVARSFLDGFEWDMKFLARYGMYHVDFIVPERNRTLKAFGTEYKQIIMNNGFPTDQLTELLPITSSQVMESTTSDFTMLPGSNYPSDAGVSVWEEFSSLPPREADIFHYGNFPDEFKWSVSTSAYQIEGGWDADGKGESIWDRFSHTPGKIANDETGDVACDSYHKVEEDVNLLKTVGVNQYRFSIAWTRIFPDGTKSRVNQPGVDYYNRLIDTLIAAGIEPVVTLYHWDLPQALEDVGGLLNDTVVEHFNDYADFCFKTYGDRVKFWITFNEPYVVTWLGYGIGVFAPGVYQPGTAPYKSAYNIIRSHAKAYRTYERLYKFSQGGRVGMTLSTEWAEPKDPNNPEDVKAADRMLQFIIGLFAHPIFKNGDFPEIVKELVASKSKDQGLSESRLPEFTDEEKEEIAGTYDFFAINGYTSRIVTSQTKPLFPPSYESDRDTHEEAIPGAAQAYPDWLQVVPWGMRRLLNWIDREYNHPPIYITENGVGTSYATVDDQVRVLYYKSYINEALKAHRLDGVDLRGYTAWSLMDNFEWNSGYGPRFGLFEVDFDDDARPRIPKRSSLFYNEVIRNNGFPPLERDERINGNFPENFIWAAATSSYQIEGAWNSDGKGLGIWDQTSHTPGLVANGDTGDIACDSYNKPEVDIELLRRLGVTHYRFSLSWPRLLPSGRYETESDLNPSAVNYYNTLIDGLIRANIEPMVTLYHWDLPLILQYEFGGWPGEEIIDVFETYADVCFREFGDRVKRWITFNEPWVFTVLGYSDGVHSPNIKDPGRSEYKAAHNMLLSHAKAYHLYADKYRSTQGGQVGMTCNSDWHEPRNTYREADYDATDRVMQFFLGWFAHPVYKRDYPDVMKTYVDMRSKAQGESTSRLPKFTEEELDLISGTSDFFGLNHYTSDLAYASYNPENLNNVGYYEDREASTEQDYTYNQAASSWLKEIPWGIRRLLKFVKEEYNDPPIIITENGISEEEDSNELNDWWRKQYYYNYINEVLKAMTLDDVNVIGYTAWSFMDNFEWAEGYTERFGMHWVDFNDPDRPRIPKQSTYCYMDIMRNSFPSKGLEYCGKNSTQAPPWIPEPATTNKPTGTTTSSGGGTETTPGAHTTTISLPIVIGPPQFLGLSLTKEESEIALYVLFGLTILFFAGTTLFAVKVFMGKTLVKKGGNAYAMAGNGNTNSTYVNGGSENPVAKKDDTLL